MEFEATARERAHYDHQAKSLLSEHSALADAYEHSQREPSKGFVREAYRAWTDAVSALPRKAGYRVLDYCSGQGQHAVTMQRRLPKAEIVGMDISGVAVEVANRMAGELFPKGNRPTFSEMDAHALDFPDASFDCVSDFGAFSSLRFEPALSEALRVLKPGGCFLGLETFGHNPVMNLKRRWNVLRGSRTAWAAANILTTDHLKTMESRLSRVEFRFFGFSTMLYGLSPVKPEPLLRLLEALDRETFRRASALSKYAFKVFWVGIK